MNEILVSWIGFTDIRASDGSGEVGLGPVGQAATEGKYSKIVLIFDLPKKEVDNYIKWLKRKTPVKITLHEATLSGPTSFGEIYEATVDIVKKTLKIHSNARLTFHLSPGTPTMAAVWIILAKTRFPADLIESSKEHGVKTASVPFDISAEFIPDLLHGPDNRLKRLSPESPPEAPEFDDIVHRCRPMTRLISKARRIAPRSVPVLIDGESGIGKELLARAIHKAGLREGKPFIAVNCGAVPQELTESALFGHEKGAFTGAEKLQKGYFETTNRGTLFLDEIGELYFSAQVKLLRALQENEIVRVDATRPIKIDARIIAATNRNLIEEIRKNRFRADLFYRLAVAILHLPPLRDRKGDISILINHLLEKLNEESREEPGYIYKFLLPQEIFCLDTTGPEMSGNCSTLSEGLLYGPKKRLFKVKIYKKP